MLESPVQPGWLCNPSTFHLTFQLLDLSLSLRKLYKYFSLFVPPPPPPLSFFCLCVHVCKCVRACTRVCVRGQNWILCNADVEAARVDLQLCVVQTVDVHHRDSSCPHADSLTPDQVLTLGFVCLALVSTRITADHSRLAVHRGRLCTRCLSDTETVSTKRRCLFQRFMF